jgi:diadenylate cyclase
MTMDNMMIFFSGIRWQDIIDIALMSYIIFRLYILFKGTNVFRVLLGIALLWFFQRIASELGLIVTTWAIQGITAVAAIILIVIFRNEIRSVLQTKNLGSFLWGLHLKSVDTPGDVIAESVFHLASKRHGALIVLPGKEDIHETVHSGIAWEGTVSKEMLTSIFWPDNPVHDGAAFVKGNKVVQVGAVLPLSRRPDLPSYYGTRHRAAAGLAEISDALVIIISEERGSVTVAKNSNIFHVNSKKELSDLIKEHQGSIFTGPSRIFKKQKMELARAALVSFLLITVIWLIFTKGSDRLISLEVPIEYTKRQSGLDIYDTSVDNVRLDLSGSSTLLKSVKSENVRVTIDLSNSLIGQNKCLLSEDNISLPPGILLNNIKPSYVNVTLDKTADKKIPIQVDWKGKLSENMTLSNVIIEPPEVKLSGRSTVLKDISTIYTEKIPLGSLNKSGELTIGILLGDPSLKLIDSTGNVTIRYIIKEKVKEKVNTKQKKN